MTVSTKILNIDNHVFKSAHDSSKIIKHCIFKYDFFN